MSPVFRHGGLRLYLLKLLDEAPRHGYDVIRLLQDRFMGVYSPSPGTIYPRLARLEEEGLVTHEVIEGKKVYKITDAGREELNRRFDDLADLESELTASVRDIARELSRDVRETVRNLRDEFTWAVREAGRAGGGERQGGAGWTGETERQSGNRGPGGAGDAPGPGGPGTAREPGTGSEPGTAREPGNGRPDQEADRAQAEADRIRAEADRLRAEADQAQARADRARAAADQAREATRAAQRGGGASGGGASGSGGTRDEDAAEGQYGDVWSEAAAESLTADTPDQGQHAAGQDATGLEATGGDSEPEGGDQGEQRRRGPGSGWREWAEWAERRDWRDWAAWAENRDWRELVGNQQEWKDWAKASSREWRDRARASQQDWKERARAGQQEWAANRSRRSRPESELAVDLERLAAAFARELRGVAWQAGSLSEDAVGNLGRILTDALNRIRTEVFRAPDDSEDSR